MDNPLWDLDNLAGYWKFNSGDGDILYDHSGNQNHGTIEGAIWEEIIEGCSDPLAENYNVNANYDDGSCEYPSNGDYSLNFDGVDDYVEVVNWNGIIGDYTIEALVKLNSENDTQTILSHSDNFATAILAPLGWMFYQTGPLFQMVGKKYQWWLFPFRCESFKY